MIYDEESDRHVHITALSALAASCYGVDGGPNQLPSGADSDLFNIRKFTDTSSAGVKYAASCAKAVTKPKKSDNATDILKLSDVLSDYKSKITNPDAMPLDGFDAGQCLAAAGVAVKWVKDCIANGIWCPIELVVCRPFIEHLMLSAVVTVAGRDTGATLFGPADMCVHTSSLRTTPAALPPRSPTDELRLGITGRSPRTPR
tara:strand:- start:2730 stop:3335 length:606 start_codon:yes stop_codon:yes gene_type:complete